MKTLQQLVPDAAARAPLAPAVRGPDGAYNYVQLESWANRFARALGSVGVSAGDRVGLWGEKSCGLIAAMQGVLKLGAAYVPIATHTPLARAGATLKDCEVRAVITKRSRLGELTRDGYTPPGAVLLDDEERIFQHSPEPFPVVPASLNDLAYILYTSGSSGRPKGVCISHRNAMAFVEWAVDALGINERSRLANHAAFNFDLSVFDIYAAFRSRASVSIVPEEFSFSPVQLVEFIRREKITVWYSVPSALVLMIENGELLSQTGLFLETIIFAGEVFPIGSLRVMRQAWPGVALWNFYGPTETNVCTAYKVVAIDPGRTAPVPIGRACSGDRVWLEGGRDEGELIVDGPTVMLGYWGVEPQQGCSYATGDICRLDSNGDFVFVGRKDGMIKIRGHRVELGEVELALATYPGIRDVAVIAMGEGAEQRLVAFYVTAASPPPSLIALKTHASLRLPTYMLPAFAMPIDSMPRTPNGKVDRQALLRIANCLGPPSRKLSAVR